MKDITPVLKALGFLDSETKTYRAALESGPQTVLDLTKKTGLSRQATYVAIETLTERGLMSSALLEKKRLYSAEHPDKLLAYAKRREAEMEERVKDLERSLPDLELQIGGERPTVKVFEGKEGLRTLIEDMRNLKGVHEIYEITDMDALYASVDLKDLEPLHTRVRERKPTVIGLYSGEHRSPPTNTANERFTIPKELGGFKSDIHIYGNKIALITFEGKMHSIIIESDGLVKALRVLFTYAAEHARKHLQKGK